MSIARQSNVMAAPDLRPEPWMARGECARRGTDGKPIHNPDLWFPSPRADTRNVRALCAGCPVSLACWDYAKRTGQHNGIWGGINFGSDRGDE